MVYGRSPARCVRLECQVRAAHNTAAQCLSPPENQYIHLNSFHIASVQSAVSKHNWLQTVTCEGMFFEPETGSDITGLRESSRHTLC